MAEGGINTKQIAASILSDKTPLIDESPTRSGKELKKSIGFFHAFVHMVTLLFGSGIFISPGLIARQSANMGMALLVWVLSAVPSTFGALCYVELACMLRRTGGRYVFVLEAFGKSMGFFAIWAQLFVTTPSAFAVFSISIGEHLIQPFYDITSVEGIWMVKGIAVFCLVLALVSNCMSTSFVNKTQVLVIAAQTLAVLLIVIVGIWKVASGHTSNYLQMFNNTKSFDAGKFGLALNDGFWAYAAWGLVGSVTEELQDLHHDLYLSVVTGFPFVAGCYVLVNLAFMSVLSHEQIGSSATVATTFIQAALGKNASLVIPVAVAISCFGSLNGSLFMMSRVLLAAAREGQMPGHYVYIHKHKRTPIPAAIFFFVFSMLWVLLSGSGTETIISYYAMAMWATHVPAILAVIVLRVKRPNDKRPIKVWIINPVITAIMALFLLALPFILQPIESSICLVILLISFPVYYFCLVRNLKIPQFLLRINEGIYRFLEHHCSLVPCVFKDAEQEEKDTNF